MAKKATAKNTPKAATPKAETPEQSSTVVGGIAADDLEVLNGDIDSRMAALLKDHQEMGSRPK